MPKYTKWRIENELNCEKCVFYGGIIFSWILYTITYFNYLLTYICNAKY